jgi:hypothetical protein
MSDDYWHHIYIDYRPYLPTRYNGLPDRCDNHSDHGPAKGRRDEVDYPQGLVFAAMATASIWRETPLNFILLSPMNK